MRVQEGKEHNPWDSAACTTSSIEDVMFIVLLSTSSVKESHERARPILHIEIFTCLYLPWCRRLNR